jgi:hypothetical protein
MLRKDENNFRVILLNDYKYSKKFCNNSVKTSKYTWWNFIFKCLFEQFKHVSNIYFLIVMILNVLFVYFVM